MPFSFYEHLWMNHSHCVANDPTVIAMDTIGNGLTALAYMLIPALLLRLILGVWSESSKETKLLIVHGAAFVFLCGCSHVMGIWNWWHADYDIQAWIVLFTGIVSLMFVYRIYRFISQQKWQA